VDTALELCYPNLTRKVRRALNKALSAENNAGRLRTDWAGLEAEEEVGQSSNCGPSSAQPASPASAPRPS
jgi:hypothetical protein